MYVGVLLPGRIWGRSLHWLHCWPLLRQPLRSKCPLRKEWWERRMTTIFACSSRLHSWICFRHICMWPNDCIHLLTSKTLFLAAWWPSASLYPPATAWPCLLGGPPSPVSLNAVVIDARLSRGGPSSNSSSIPSPKVFHVFLPPRKPCHLQVSRWLHWWPVCSL